MNRPPTFIWTGAQTAAERILGLVGAKVPMASVVDVGCGTGTWLAAALAHGATRAVGVDAPYVSQADMVDGRIDFRSQDLETQIALDERFDLALCLEVAEHLSEDRAESFVRDLCGLSEVVLFGAAIPGQRGAGHINERWQSYWSALFAKHGYHPVDLVRPVVEGDRTIQPWYRQNTLLYLSEASCVRILGTAEPPPVLLDVVVPDIYQRSPTGRERVRLAASLPGLAFARLTRLFRRH